MRSILGDSAPTPKEYSSASELSRTLFNELNYAKKLKESELPPIFTLDIVPYDPDLFRMLHKVSANDEKRIRYHRYDLWCDSSPDSFYGKLKPLHCSRRLKDSLDKDRKERGLLLGIGINLYDDLLATQHLCFSSNLHSDKEFYWCFLDPKLTTRLDKLRRIGVIDHFDIPDIPEPSSQKYKYYMQYAFDEYVEVLDV